MALSRPPRWYGGFDAEGDAMSELRVIDAAGDVTVVALVGRLDLAGTEELSLRFTAAVSARKRPAIVDLNEVTFLASLGMRMLISAARALRLSGSRLVLGNPQRRVHDALDAGGLLDLLPTARGEVEGRQLALGVA